MDTEFEQTFFNGVTSNSKIWQYVYLYDFNLMFWEKI